MQTAAAACNAVTLGRCGATINSVNGNYDKPSKAGRARGFDESTRPVAGPVNLVSRGWEPTTTSATPTTVIQPVRTIYLFTSLAFALFFGSATAQEVVIPDPGLDAAIREALQKPTGPLTEPDLLSLTHLDAPNRNIEPFRD